VAETMMRFSAAQLQQMHDRAVERERTRIAEEIAGRAMVERTLDNATVADVLDEIVASLAGTAPKRLSHGAALAELQPSRRDDEVPIGPGAGGAKKWVPTQAEIERETQRLLVPGMEREPFRGYDGTDDGLAPARERSDDEDIHRLIR
jgi:hypothetical protein